MRPARGDRRHSGRQGAGRDCAGARSLNGWLTRDLIFVIMFLIGIARAFELPTIHAILPDIVPQSVLPRAIAAAASAQQTAIITGPAIGGLLYLLGPYTVYFCCMAIFVAAAVLVSFVHTAHARRERAPMTLESLFAGFSYIRDRQVLFGVISLDLFAVCSAAYRAAAGFRPRRARHRPVGAWPVALGACDRCARHVGGARRITPSRAAPALISSPLWPPMD